MRAVLVLFPVLALAASAPAKPPAAADGGGLLIALDPGHGGANSGAPAAVRGKNEKHFTLEMTRVLAAELRARGARVIVTRTGDEYLTLRQRSAMANAAGADIFVSIHGNASPDHSRAGFETFFLSPSALDIDGRALRTIGPQRAGLNLPLSRLIDDVERGMAHPKSQALAAAIQKRLAEVRPNSPNRGVKQESMHVLLGANMPAVLVELGFIDHSVEGLELFEPSVQKEMASALADALLE